MTLYKQMGIAVSFIIITMLGSVMTLSYNSTKKDMVQNVYEASLNNIATLVRDLSEAADENAHISTVIDAAFDSGYYKLIEYHSSDGKFSYKKIEHEKIEDVPSWFIDFADIKLTTIKEDVSSGWQMVGEVKILGDSSIIYKSLYNTFIKLIYLFAGFTFASLVFLSLLLSIILKPLKEIQSQAEAILRDEFVIQEKVPYTTEFKELVRGMNMMVKKAEYIFIKGSETLKRNQELLYVDSLTKLYNRRYLLLKLPDLIMLENRANGGTIIFCGLSGAEILNQTLGREAADKMFCDFADALLGICEEFEDGIVARVNGTEFTLVLPNCDASRCIGLAEDIHKAYEKLLVKNGLQEDSVTLDVGMYRYRPNVKVSELLTHADEALTQAKADEFSSTYIYEEKDDEAAMGKEQWREIIEKSIEKKYVSLKFWPMLERRTGVVDHNVMTFIIDDKKHKRYCYGDFIAPAINLGMVSKMYMAALQELIVKEHPELDNTLCCVRLSNEFIKDTQSFEALSSLLKEHLKSLSFKLSFEIADTFAVRNPMLVKSFIELFKLHGCGFGFNSFTGESDDFAYLKVFNPDFIKADASFLLDQSRDSMNAIQIITDSLGIKIIATFVQTQEELQALNALGIYKVQGPITDSITN